MNAAHRSNSINNSTQQRACGLSSQQLALAHADALLRVDFNLHTDTSTNEALPCDSTSHINGHPTTTTTTTSDDAIRGDTTFARQRAYYYCHYVWPYSGVQFLSPAPTEVKLAQTLFFPSTWRIVRRTQSRTRTDR